MPDIDWSKVEVLCSKTYHTGYVPTMEEMELLQAAYQADPKKYAAIRQGLVEEYTASLRGKL